MYLQEIRRNPYEKARIIVDELCNIVKGGPNAYEKLIDILENKIYFD